MQVLLPGEVARAHRHSPAAIRFIMSGNGAYTAVEGEKVIMREGDLVLTPSWLWHDHGNETGETVVWMDGLDVPLTKALDCIFFQMHQNLKADHGKPVNGSKALYGHGHLAPTWVKERPRFSPLMLYSFDQTMEALDGLRSTEGSPYEGIALEYTNPQTGGPVTPTISCRIQLVRKGEKLKARRVTGSSVFHVVRGKGRTLIDGKSFDWEQGRHRRAAELGTARAREHRRRGRDPVLDQRPAGDRGARLLPRGSVGVSPFLVFSAPGSPAASPRRRGSSGMQRNRAVEDLRRPVARIVVQERTDAGELVLHVGELAAARRPG